MLVLKLLSHGWKQSLRSASRGQNTAGQVIVGVMILLIGLNLLGLGLFLHAILKELEPGTDPLLVFNGWVVCYLGIELVLRQMFQRIPGQAIVPYLTLRLRRSLLVHLLLSRSFFSFFNLLPWALIIPFAVTAVIPGAGLAGALAWMAFLACLIASNSLLNLLLKKLAFNGFAVAGALTAVIAGLFALDRLQVISLASFSRDALGAVIGTPALFIVGLLGPMLLYAITFAVLRHKMYLEDLYRSTAIRGSAASRYRFLESTGDRGRFIALELKLFFRNRRSRASIVTALIVLPLGILFYGMMLKAQRDPYPLPSGPLLKSARLSEPTVASPGYALVTFRVDTGIVPAFAQIYVTGDHPALAKWKPATIPLFRNADSSWSRSFLLEVGTNLRYCFTLGSWETEEKVGDGSKPPTYTMSVRGDTTVVRSAIAWKTPDDHLFITINLLYWGLLITGILMFAYGQFFLAWDSTFFDALLTWRIRFRWLVETKVLVMFAAGAISFLLTVPYVLMDEKILLYNSLAFVYNIGVNSYVLLFLASRHRKRFDLQESIFSQQGKSAVQFVAILPMWFLPVIVFAVLDVVGVPYALYVVFGGLGLLGLVLHRPLMRRMVVLLENSRYSIASGFRQGGTI
jgi:Family of unknown function (DUF5687)/Starch binding domain